MAATHEGVKSFIATPDLGVAMKDLTPDGDGLSSRGSDGAMWQ
jgi:hypothetical protein